VLGFGVRRRGVWCLGFGVKCPSVVGSLPGLVLLVAYMADTPKSRNDEMKKRRCPGLN
jgi:hypothetical protein